MLRRSSIRLSLAGLMLAAGVVGISPGAATAAGFKGECSIPFSNGSGGGDPLVTDCLFILKAAVGSATCDRPCICAPRGSLPVRATDALLCLFKSVGSPTADLNCPCSSRIDLQNDKYLFDPTTDVVDAAIRPHFTSTNYIGAFPQDEEASTGDWTAGWTINLHGNNTIWGPSSEGTLMGGVPSADGGCPAGTTDVGNTALPGGFAGTMDICQLPARYAVDMGTLTLTNDNIYTLGGAGNQGTFIGDGDGAMQTAATAVESTLAIEPGTLILGDTSEALSITRGSNIVVNGTATSPVVMRSLTWFNDWLAGSDGSAGRGEWGGLIVTGFGVANQCNSMTSCDALVEGFLNDFYYGGFDDSDDSGEIHYLVIGQSGYDLDGMGSELQGLTLYSIGTGTDIDHVQVHLSGDDGIEFFGGKAVVTHAVITGAQDDSLDTDLGFSGGVQFALVQQYTDTADRGIESDNHPTTFSTAPITQPTWANVTILGAPAGEQSPTGIVMRTGSGGYLWNGIIVDSKRSCIRMGNNSMTQNAGTLSDPDDGVMQIHNYVIDCADGSTGNFDPSGTDTLANMQTWYGADPNNRQADPRLGDHGYPSSPYLTGPMYEFDPATDVDPSIASHFDATDFIGAFNQDEDPSTGDWTRGWTVALHGNDNVWAPASSGTLNGATPAADNKCPKDTTDVGDTAMPAPFMGTMDICQLPARFAKNNQTLALTNDNVYTLGGAANQGTFIGDGDAALKTAANTVHSTLTIEPGTLILGDTSEALSITRGSQIFVNGTAADPVVMTSLSQFVDWRDGVSATGNRSEWGGLIVTGFGVANQCNNMTSCDALVEGFLNDFYYGGFDNGDDSGQISYLVVQQSGYDLDGMGSELQAVTLYAIGTETEIDHIQAHLSGDDGIEFFGGRAVVKYAVVTGAQDDSLDTDLGFAGGVQFGLVQQYTDTADRGIESDNHPTTFSTAPITQPVWANLTILGAPVGEQTPTGIIMRTGSGGFLWNGIVQDSKRSCIRMGNNSMTQNAGVLGDPDDGVMQIHNFVVNCPDGTHGNFDPSGTDTLPNIQTWFDAATTNREVDPVLSSTGYPAPPLH